MLDHHLSERPIENSYLERYLFATEVVDFFNTWEARDNVADANGGR